MTWAPGEPHTKPDPNRCPHCGEVSRFQFRELGSRFTWESVTLGYDEDWSDEHHTHIGTGQVVTKEYGGDYHTGADVQVSGYECTGCGSEWPDIQVLAYWQRLRQALEDWRDYHYAVAGDAREEGAPSKEVENEAAALAFEHALKILGGNGEA